MNYYYCLIVIDSRGAGLEERLKDLIAKDRLSIKITISVKYGATLSTLTNEAIELSQLKNYDLVLILGGVNNLTNKHSSGRVTSVFYTTQQLTHTMTAEFTRAQQTFLSHSWTPNLSKSLSSTAGHQ